LKHVNNPFRPISYTRTFDRASPYGRYSCTFTRPLLFEQQSTLLALLNPILHSLPNTLNLLFRHRQTHLAVRLASLHEVLNTLSHTQVVVSHHRVLLLPAPHEVADVLGGARHDVVCGGHTSNDRRNEADENVPVARDDRTSHGGYQHVDSTGKELLVALFGRSQRADCGCDVVLGVQGAGHAGVDCALGSCGVVVEEQARACDLGCEAVCGRGTAGEGVGEVLLVLRLIRFAGGGWRSGGCDLADGGLGGCVVDGLALALEDLLERG
jgi:hypothetical protein